MPDHNLRDHHTARLYVFGQDYNKRAFATAALTRIERARGFLEAATLSEEWRRVTEERALVLEAHHTTHIEGTQLTLEQAERLLAGETLPDADPDDVRELLNYRRARSTLFRSTWAAVRR